MFHTSLILVINSDNSHLDNLLSFIKTLDHTKDLTANNPNLQIFNQDDSGVKIELVRKFISDLSLNAFYADQCRIMAILNCDSASKPAQNALLKAIEEPPENTQIILTVSNPNSLLETIRSRCNIFTKPKGKKEETKRNLLSGFLPSGFNEAINLSEKLKDRNTAIDFIESTIKSLHEQNSQKPDGLIIRQLKILSETLSHLKANVNVRLALEHGFFKLKALPFRGETRV